MSYLCKAATPDPGKGTVSPGPGSRQAKTGKMYCIGIMYYVMLLNIDVIAPLQCC